MTRLPARVAPRIGALCAVALGAAAAWAASALAWSSPAAIYSNAAPQVLAVAGDPAGNAFAVYEGGTLDAPLLLSERSVRDARSELMSLAWSTPRPLPGNVESFTNAAPTLTAATAGASGDGAGVVALRYGASLLTALVREPLHEFGTPATLAGGGLGRIDTPVVSVSDNGASVVAFHAAGGRSGTGRVHYSFRPPGGLFTRVNALASSDGPLPAVAQAADGWPVITWTNGRTVYAARIGDAGRATAPQRLGASKRRGPVSAAVGLGGDGLVAWVDTDRYVRVVRRSAPGAFSASLPLHRPAAGTTMTDLAAAVDPKGRAFVTWRETKGSSRAIYVAQAPIDGSFRVTRLASGGDLGRPVITARPDGGAGVAWPTAPGWQAVTTPAAKWSTPAKVSAALSGGDLDGDGAQLIAGPGLRVELVWRQLGSAEPATGPVVYAAADSGT